jgi:hypothetical protein
MTEDKSLYFEQQQNQLITLTHLAEVIGEAQSFLFEEIRLDDYGPEQLADVRRRVENLIRILFRAESEITDFWGFVLDTINEQPAGSGDEKQD